MTLREVALAMCAAIQSGSLNDVEHLISELNHRASEQSNPEKLLEAMAVLQEARQAIHAHRAHIVHSLQHLDRSSLYARVLMHSGASWELAG